MLHGVAVVVIALHMFRCSMLYTLSLSLTNSIKIEIVRTWGAHNVLIVHWYVLNTT